MNVQPISSIKAEGSSEDAFASTLRELMIAKRISASDLARGVWGTTTDGRGYEVAKNRDRVGHYLAGRSHPSKENLGKIAKVLGVKVEVLERVQPTPVVREMKAAKDIDVIFYTEGPNKGAASVSASKLLLSLKTVMEFMDLVAKDPIYSAKTKDKKKSK